MSDDYMTRLARDVRLAYGDLETGEFVNVVDELEAETRRVIRERAAFVCLTTPQAVALLMTLTELGDVFRFYRERQR